MKKRCFLLLLVIVCFLTAFPSMAQNANTVDTVYYRYFSLNDFFISEFRQERPIDTLLDGFQLYEPLRFGQSLGNTGNAFRSFRPQALINRGFVAHNNAFGFYMPHHSDLRYYNVSAPFTDLYYVMGSKKEQILKVIHTQNIRKDFNVALDYRIINSPGSFRRQFSDVTSFVGSSHYTGKKKRYRLIGNVLFNKCNNQENGGLANTSEYDGDLLGRAELYDIRLTNAQNKLKERGVFVKQFFHFNKIETRDSSGQILNRTYRTNISHSILARRESFSYFDNNPSPWYYPLFHFDNNFTGDSTRHNTLDNTIGLSHSFFFKQSLKPFITVNTGLTYRYIDYRQFVGTKKDSIIHQQKEKHFFNQYIPFAGFLFHPFENLSGNAEIYAVTGDYNDGDWGGLGKILYTINPYHSLELMVNFSLAQPAFTYSRYTSNHFLWQYDFEKLKTTDIAIKYNFSGYRFELMWRHMQNNIYMNAYARPAQFPDNLNLLFGALHKNFRLNAFNFNNTIYFQFSDNENIMPLPLLATYHSLNWGAHVFKKALFAQIGIDLHYNTAYYAPSYMPALRTFYIQNQQETGHYPLLDIYINMTIQNARIFVKATHLNERLVGNNLYGTPGYPLQGRAFKLGISWIFRD